jgi:hypothetical protein
VRPNQLSNLFASFSIAVLAGCGGGSTNTGGTTQTPNPTTVNYTFTGGTPTAVAAQMGTGTFTTTTLQAGKLSVSVPSGTTNYAVAYVCPPAADFGNTVTAENVIEASTQDGASFTVSCYASAGTTGSATGSVNASAIPGATNVLIRGNQGYGTSVGASTGSFNASLLTGSNDVALLAVNSSGAVLAVKILRSQTVPGAVNGGSSIVFATTDETTTQSLTVNGVPAGDVTPPAEAVEYITAGGTSFDLSNNATTQYPGMPSASVASGDFYSFEANTNDTATHTAAVGITQDSTSGGSATLDLPAAWTYAGPTAAILPTFNFSYSGFSGMAATAQEGEIEWEPTATTLDTITVIATSNYQGSATSVTIPNLSALTGFLGSATAGATVYWNADILGGSAQEFAFYPSMPSSGSISFVQKSGTFIQP